MNKLVSIIVPVYNSEKFLKNSIESVLEQTYKNIELILIDDGSTDNSLEVCNNFRLKDERVKIISTENKGVSNARNLGIKNAQGKYIMFCDSDDLYHKKYIQIMVESLELANSELGICQYHKFKENIDIKKLRSINNTTNYKDKDEIFNFILFDEKLSGYVWNKIFIREIIIKNNLYFDCLIDEIEDLYFVVQYLKYVKKVTKIEEQLYFYRDNPQSIMNQSFNLKKYSSIYGRINIYTEVKNINVNDNIKKKVWIQAIQCCFSYLKNIIFSRTFTNKKKYLREIVILFNSINCDYKKYSKYGYIFKIKFFILSIVSYSIKFFE